MSHETDPLQSIAWKGLFLGAFIGLIVGLVISGPHFHSWPVGNTLKVILGSTAAASFVGYFAIPLFVGALAKGGSGISGGGGSSDGESLGVNLSNQLHSVSHDHSGHHHGGEASHGSHTDDGGAF